MEININGNPGRENSYNIIQISHLDNYNPNAKEVHNHKHDGCMIVIHILLLFIQVNLAKVDQQSFLFQYDKVKEKIEHIEQGIEDLEQGECETVRAVVLTWYKK